MVTIPEKIIVKNVTSDVLSKRSNGDKHSCYKMGTYNYMKNSNKKFCEISMNLKI